MDTSSVAWETVTVVLLRTICKRGVTVSMSVTNAGFPTPGEGGCHAPGEGVSHSPGEGKTGRQLPRSSRVACTRNVTVMSKLLWRGRECYS